jgi:hypothetical protein
MKTFCRLLLVLSVVPLLLLACDLSIVPGLGSSETPETGAKAFLQALADQDGITLDDRTCAAYKGKLQGGDLLAEAFMVIGQNLLGEKPKIDISQVTVKTMKSQGDYATVQVSGNLRVAIGLSVQSQSLDQNWAMRREDGKWKFCGASAAALPPPSASATQQSAKSPIKAPTRQPLLITIERHPQSSGSPKHYTSSDLPRFLLTQADVPAGMTQVLYSAGGDRAFVKWQLPVSVATCASELCTIDSVADEYANDDATSQALRRFANGFSDFEHNGFLLPPQKIVSAIKSPPMVLAMRDSVFGWTAQLRP